MVDIPITDTSYPASGGVSSAGSSWGRSGRMRGRGRRGRGGVMGRPESSGSKRWSPLSFHLGRFAHAMRGVSPRISVEQTQQLTCPFELDEIRAALFSMVLNV
ncbi:hypothetical protein Salat_0184300 [Sesamum alatum]|uniref:Uncharacterized protein n=1 Tax=Sesamum alatum TaxID=300844 RepID=A0AAE2CXY8_9LAMI|nr:hypothetical protein Salat_0184300 [Sesamum alatum]